MFTTYHIKSLINKMPQLDVNIFLTQYTAIMLLLVSIYIILGYIVLPLTLRLLLIRSLFLSTSSFYSGLENFQLPPMFYLIILTKRPIYLGQLLNTTMKNLFFFQKALLSSIQGALFVTCNSNLDRGRGLVGIYQAIMLESTLSYLIMFLCINQYTND